MKVIFYRLMIFLVSLLIISACSKKPKQEKKDELAEIEVKTQLVKLSSIEQTYKLSATLIGENETDVYSKLPGKLLKKIYQEGDFVLKDQSVCLIDRDEPAMEYSVVEVKSPINGMITKYFVDIGETVMPQTGMSKPVFRVSNIDKIKAEAFVGEKEINLIKTGQRCKIYTENSSNRKTFYGKVTKKSPSFDIVTNKSKIEIEIENVGHILRPGMFVEIEVVIDNKYNVIVLPKNSVIEETYQTKKIVYVIRDNKIYEQEVKTGIETETEVEIISGLKLNDEIITQGFFGIVDGTPVRRIK